MDMSNFSPEIHVAQQSRRDKLRHIHNNSISQQNHHLGVNSYVNNLEPHHFRPGDICYNPLQVCLGMLDFPPNQESEKRAPFENFYREIPTTVSSDHDNTQYFATWKTIGSQSTSDNWVPNNNNHNQSPIYAGARLPTFETVKPNYLGYDNPSSVDNNMHCTSSLYQNALQELISQKGSQETSSHWGGGGGGGGPQESRVLSLSLSSVPSPRVHATQNVADRGIQDPITAWKPSFLTGGSNLVSGQGSSHRNVGPLGPFTGYSAILRSSKYLRPAEQLLEEHCRGARPESGDKVLEEARVSMDDFDEPDLNGVAGDSGGGSSLAFKGSNDYCPPENLQKKAKLIFMQDEVCKKYKQYHQQIQMVVSSFESVAGLSAATPYVSLALKTVTKHFHSLKNAIADQLKSIRNAVGEELLSPCGDTRSLKGDAAGVSVLKFFDQSLQKQKAAGGLGILESQHIWRPQRGLPERAVSILRAWLFDHFLHPYPTDTDKHMLATQTGLTRSQVSNWFINARVRVWKPMVEEIHMLETKGVTEKGEVSLNAPKIAIDHNEGFDQSNESSSSQWKQMEYSSRGEDAVGSNGNVMSNQEKRCRIEYGVPSMMGSVMPSLYRSGPPDIGSVSLTLGLRQSAESGQRARFGGQVIRDFVG